MRTIFNESFEEKEICEPCEQCTGPIGKAPQPQNVLQKKKKNANIDT